MHSHLGQRRTTVSRPLGSAELIFRPRRSNGGRPAVLQERNATMRYARIEGIGIIPYWEFNKLAPQPTPLCAGRDPDYNPCNAVLTFCAEDSTEVSPYFAVRLGISEHIPDCNHANHVDPDSPAPVGQSKRRQGARRGEIILDLLTAQPGTTRTRTPAPTTPDAGSTRSRRRRSKNPTTGNPTRRPSSQAAPLSLLADQLEAGTLPPDRKVRLARRTSTVADVLRTPETITASDIGSGSWIILHAPIRNIGASPASQALFINISSYGTRPSLAVLLPADRQPVARSAAKNLRRQRHNGWNVVAIGYLRRTRKGDVLLHPYDSPHAASPSVLLTPPPGTIPPTPAAGAPLPS